MSKKGGGGRSKSGGGGGGGGGGSSASQVSRHDAAILRQEIETVASNCGGTGSNLVSQINSSSLDKDAKDFLHEGRQLCNAAVHAPVSSADVFDDGSKPEASNI